MKISKKRKGNAVVEYALVLVLVGLAFIGLMLLDTSADPGKSSKDKYKTYFGKSFANSTFSGDTLTIGPLGP